MFRERSTKLELLDGSDLSRTMVKRSYRFMSFVNRYLGGAGAVRQFVEQEAARTNGRPLRVLDIGCGACDVPLAVSRWARLHGLDVRFTCLDVNPHARRLCEAKLRRAKEAAVTVVGEDIFEHEPDEPYDCAVGSMFFHHVSDQNLLPLIDRLRRFVRGSLLINDLQRSGTLYASCVMAGAVLPRELRHDALLSIRRGFKVKELRALLARLENVLVTVEAAWYFRVRAIVRFLDAQGQEVSAQRSAA